MSQKNYGRIASVSHDSGPDWRWRRAVVLAGGDPHGGRYTDDEITIRAARAWAGDDDPGLDDIRAAWSVHQSGGLRQRSVEAYLLTDLPEEEVAHHTGLTPAAVIAYAALFFSVRGHHPLSRELRAEARGSSDPLVRAARHGGAGLVMARVRYEAGDPHLGVELAERFEREELLDGLLDHDPEAYVRAIDRMRAIRGVLPVTDVYQGRPRLW